MFNAKPQATNGIKHTKSTINRNIWHVNKLYNMRSGENRRRSLQFTRLKVHKYRGQNLLWRAAYLINM